MISCTIKIWNVSSLKTVEAVSLPVQKRLLQAARVDFAKWQNELPKAVSRLDDLLTRARQKLARIDEPHFLVFPVG